MSNREGIERDPVLAARAYTLGCQGGNAESCVEAARFLLREAADQMAAAAPVPTVGEGGLAAIASGAPSSSGGAAATAAPPLSPQQQPLPPPPPPAAVSSALREGLALLAQGCEADRTVSHGRCCGMLAAAYFSTRLPVARMWRITAAGEPAERAPPPTLTGVAPNAASAAAAGSAATPLLLPHPLELLQRACDTEHADSCMLLGKLHRLGHPELGIARDSAAGAAFERRGLLWNGASERQADRWLARRL